ncbi:MAG: single-stranded DNA-binding protein [Rhodococcus sp. (in: high G+C Gram-positive bacteria)]|uniref:single-stranded DNA-binding protein n=1 Tax=Rhodococcus sp. TaxID=1831 RepID=UPI003BAE5C62
MYETHGTVVGTIITAPVTRSNSDGEEFLSFRMASTVRRRDFSTGDWRDGSTLYLTVTCRRRLMAGVAQSLAKGDPVMVTGEMQTSEYTSRDGTARSDLQLRATAIGPDLSRCTVTVERERRAAPDAVGDATAVPDADSLVA